MPKKFFRSVEQLLRQIDHSGGPEEMLRLILRRLVETYAAVYGIESGRLYREREQDYILIESIGEYGRAIAGKTIDKAYPIVRQIERDRLVEISPQSPGFDPEVESQFTQLDNTAILVGQNPAYILSLGIHYTGTHEDLLILLESIRTAIGLKLRQNVLEDQLHQAQIIQSSLLPHRLPQSGGFEVAAMTIAADEVGGDIYDVQRVGQDLLGIVVADASGHGLPAALQARDVIVGLRVGMDKDEKITAIVQRLNRVIHMSGLSSRFVSLFFGELEKNGDIFYVNCGHCPPLVMTRKGEVCELMTSGPVLGPLPKANFQRRYARLNTGDYLIIFSDGVTERKAVRPSPAAGGPAAGRSGADPDAEIDEFGLDNLIRVCRENLGRSAKHLVGAIMDAVREFGGDDAWEDDVTVMVLRRRIKVQSPEETGTRR
jgi:serine phosphatase RsbU (regulator of sigma subunit)